MKNYRFGFSLKGFIGFMLVMLPNIIWMIAPPRNNPIAENSALYPIFNIVVSVSQAIMIAMLIILVSKESRNEKNIRLYIGVASFCLVSYYGLWIAYYAGVVYPWMVVCMAVFPSMYFIAIELLFKNYIAIIPSVVFGITHIVITCSNYLW